MSDDDIVNISSPDTESPVIVNGTTLEEMEPAVADSPILISAKEIVEVQAALAVTGLPELPKTMKAAFICEHGGPQQLKACDRIVATTDCVVWRYEHSSRNWQTTTDSCPGCRCESN